MTCCRSSSSSSRLLQQLALQREAHEERPYQLLDSSSSSRVGPRQLQQQHHPLVMGLLLVAVLEVQGSSSSQTWSFLQALRKMKQQQWLAVQQAQQAQLLLVEHRPPLQARCRLYHRPGRAQRTQQQGLLLGLTPSPASMQGDCSASVC
jgi:hypothetical protein